jgi:GT2 family glycosyltransferase
VLGSIGISGADDALTPRPSTQRPGLSARPRVQGKWLEVGTDRLHVRGVTYGTFEDGGFPAPEVVERDFAAMVANGINAVRTYAPPPPRLLDLAAAAGLYVVAGIPWEQHVTFLDDRRGADSIVERVVEGARACAGHPALLCLVVGNEIPASIVRWHGHRRVERFLERLYRAVKAEDPEALVAYANYPSTEYLQLPFFDLECWNVFLEAPEAFVRYVARLQHIAGDRPLLLTECGIDSRRHGLETQATTLDWQIRAAFAGGVAGLFVFAWTDEWHRGGYRVGDWDFGLVDAERLPKPALDSVRLGYAGAALADAGWPRITVGVCAYNAAATLDECLEHATAVDYPDFEVVLVDDGSTDETASIAARYDVRVISTPNRGLAAARNTVLEQASGEIVAYLDADAYPDRAWLSHLAAAFGASNHAGMGGPSPRPEEQGIVGSAVARTPGGPVHVMLSDVEAEHIPGCNMAFRRSCLEGVGGFDEQFRIAGDDVDVCWRVRQAGGTLGFSPGAVAWHHRRSSARAFLKQQYHYGKAEALLERKWPERYNRGGHVTWAGHIYGNAVDGAGGRRWRIYYGNAGTGLFQWGRRQPPGLIASIADLPEWYLAVVPLAALVALGAAWAPLFATVPLLLLALSVIVVRAVRGALSAPPEPGLPSRAERIRFRALTAYMHLIQPIGRLAGRLRGGLVPWRSYRIEHLALPAPRTATVWSEHWQELEAWIEKVADDLRAAKLPTVRGGPYERWDVQVRGGQLGVARLRATVEEHGGGRQLLRFRLWPRASHAGILLVGLLSSLSAAAIVGSAEAVGVALAAAAALVVAVVIRDAAAAIGVLGAAVDRLPEPAALGAPAENGAFRPLRINPGRPDLPPVGEPVAGVVPVDV